MSRSSSLRIDSEVVLRALAIASIVFNHAHRGAEPAFGYGGGMNFLMALSGYNLARFGLHERDVHQFRSSCLRLIMGVLVPTLCVLLLISVADRVAWQHWLFVGNWISWHHPAMLHIWYVETIVQLLLGMILLFSVRPVAHGFRTNPFAAAMVLFAAGLVLLVLAKELWNPPDLKGRLPQFFLWNLALGMVVFFALNGSTGPQRWRRVLILLGLTVVGVALAYGLGRLNSWWLLAAVACWVVVPRVSLWPVTARAFTVVSQAAFTIYLTHAIFLRAWRKLHFPGNAYVQFAFAFSASVGLWIVVTSLRRAYHGLEGPPLFVTKRFAFWT